MKKTEANLDNKNMFLFIEAPGVVFVVYSRSSFYLF